MRKRCSQRDRDDRAENDSAVGTAAHPKNAKFRLSLTLAPSRYKGSITEAADNMSRRELDHLKGRECDPGEQCACCDRMRARLASLPLQRKT
jgi:hypothetical protein